jgi:hypothetical protein
MDYAALGGMVVSALVAVASFGVIANYLFDHRLADRNDPFPNILALYKKYRGHTKEQTGQVNPLFWIHTAAAGAFILIGVAYTLARFLFKWTF